MYFTDNNTNIRDILHCYPCKNLLYYYSTKLYISSSSLLLLSYTDWLSLIIHSNGFASLSVKCNYFSITTSVILLLITFIPSLVYPYRSEDERIIYILNTMQRYKKYLEKPNYFEYFFIALNNNQIQKFLLCNQRNHYHFHFEICFVF